MAPDSLEVLDTTVHKTYEWLRDIAIELGDDSRHHAYLALRGTLHAVRDFLPVDESAQLSAQLPMLIRGIYFEGWNPSSASNHDRSLEHFLDRVTSGLERDPWKVERPIDGEKAARAVLRVIADHISEGEMEQVRRVMPERIRELWPVATWKD